MLLGIYLRVPIHFIFSISCLNQSYLLGLRYCSVYVYSVLILWHLYNCCYIYLKPLEHYLAQFHSYPSFWSYTFYAHILYSYYLFERYHTEIEVKYTQTHVRYVQVKLLYAEYQNKFTSLTPPKIVLVTS